MKSQNVYAESLWIELHPSRIAQILKLVFYILILVSIATWSLPLIWKSFAGLFVIACYFLDYFENRIRTLVRKKNTDIEAVVLSSDKGIIATRCGSQVRKVRSFNIEHILCYYIQLYLCYENGSYQRLYIFPDSMDEKAFHKFCCMGVRNKAKK